MRCPRGTFSNMTAW